MSKSICPECGHEHTSPVIRCENCGAELDATIVQVENGKSETLPLADDETFNEEAETTVQTRAINSELKDNEFRTGKARMRGDLLLREQDTGLVFHIPHSQLQEVVLGRRNEETGFVPTVDLADADGQKLGVSRRHATLSIQDGILVLTDHRSVNGTFLNGQRLVAEQARVVRDNDMIRLGRLKLLVSYQTK